MKRLTSVLLAAIAALYLASASAAPQAPAKPDVAAAVSAPAAAPAATQFDADKATREWLDTMSPEARKKSDAYFEGGYWLILWDFVVGLAVAWLFLGTRLSVRMRDLAERITRMRWLQTAIYAAQYIVLSSLFSLPWAIYEGWFREHQYGMSNQALGGFLGDELTGLIIGLIFGIIAIPIVYAVIRKFTRTWWIWGAVVGVVFIVFSVAIGPTYLEPAFNKFYPLVDSPLKQDILSLARANGIPAKDVYEFDASKQTKRMSAHVSGIGGTTQISMNDNLMNRASPGEIKAVLGHEMGHYVLHHVFHGIFEFSILIVIGFAFVKWAFDKVRARWGANWGIREVGDVAGLPLLGALFAVFMFVLTPISNTLTRTQEAEADAFGLNAARQPDGFAQAAIHLSEYRKMEPGKWEEILFYDHPSGYNRIHRAMVWKAENIDTPDIKAYDAAHPTIAMPPEPK
ncbi:MAG TPA: M48 family metallopeptidase [Gammaproteobacteria bacterium]|jgi:STE24 endopeptidase|nr:M48 family metallopeptidase [Gammaproteobacteria bacterium]